MSHFTAWIATLQSKHRLSKGAIAVLHAIETDPGQASYCSAQTLAEASGVNVATVVRAAQAIGYSGWTEFSSEIRNRYLASLSSQSMLDHALADSSILRGIDKDIELLQSLRATLDEEAVRTMATAIASARKTGIFATGVYAAPGLQLAHVGQMLGNDISLHNGSNTSMINAVRQLGPEDCFFAFSLWKSSRIVGQLAEFAKSRSVPICVIADRRTLIADLADHLILVPSETSGLISSLSSTTTVIQSLLDIIARTTETKSRTSLGEIDELWTMTESVFED